MDFESISGILLCALGAVLILGQLMKRVCSRTGLPASVGFIVLGLVLRSALGPLGSTPFVNDVFSALAQLGVVALLFRVGLRSHTSTLLKRLPDASVIWIVNVLGSFAAGFVAARYGFDWSRETSLVIGVAFSATSIAVSVAIWDELGLAGSEAGATLLDVAELDDLSAAVFLAVLLGILPVLLNGDSGLWLRVGTSSAIVLTKLALFVAGCYLFAHFVEARFTEFNRRLSDTPASLTISILGVGLVIAAVADFLGFSIAIGALFAGLAFSRDPQAVRTDGSFSYFYEFLTPFFFIYIGMQTDLAALAGSMDVGMLLFVVAAVSKLVFTYAPALLSMGTRDAMHLGVSMIPRAEIALVVVYECRAVDPGIVPPEVFAAMVLVSLGTSIVAPITLRRLLVSDGASRARS
ncbi:MAG TPA: cation:proton antiporter [Gammaproteobacteria bacterium]|nr:cation:proton antiporter [Gammaproteobacteria bacterium]